jgi:hypothetical protein
MSLNETALLVNSVKTGMFLFKEAEVWYKGTGIS